MPMMQTHTTNTNTGIDFPSSLIYFCFMLLYLKRLLLQRDRRRMDVRPHHGFDKPTAAQMQRHQKGLVAPRSHDRFQWASSGWVKRLRKFRDTHGIVAERIKRLQIQRDRWMRERWWIKGCANAETGTLNEVYTLAVSQCMAVLWCRALVQVFGSWCSGAAFWCWLVYGSGVGGGPGVGLRLHTTLFTDSPKPWMAAIQLIHLANQPLTKALCGSLGL